MQPGLFEELRPPLTDEQAVLEADRCLECGTAHAPAPCVVGCPADVDVPAFVAAIARGDALGAAETIFAENLLGATCSRVCPVEMLCQSGCVLEHEGLRPVEIGALQRYATDAALAAGRPLRLPATPNGRRVAVLGAGPAGLACAGELAARGYSVTVYDERTEVGGLVRFAIAPYRLHREPLPAEMHLLQELGVNFRLGKPIDGDALARIEAANDAVVLGIGLGTDADVRYPGDDLSGVWESLPFIEALKTGAPPDVRGRLIVIGGGNTAVDVAREAIRLGADEVTMVYRRTEAEMPAYPQEIQEAREEGVRFRWLSAPVRFLGHERLGGVECVAMELGEPDSSGRRSPQPVPRSEFVLPAETAVKAIGQQRRTHFLAGIAGLELDRGLVRVDPETGRTTNPKYYAAGDATNGGATVVEAVGGAKIAARAIDTALGGLR